MSMKWFIFPILALLLGFIIFFQKHPEQLQIISPLGSTQTNVKPLAKYTIPALSTSSFKPSTITFGESTNTTDSFVVMPFSFVSEGKTVSGLAHMPIGKGPFPVIVQFRGYVDPSIYTPGVGTERTAEVFAAHGFISLAPDFLGYGTSDPLSGDIFKDRFETYTTALSLISSISTISQADASRVGIWGHSNGGQIAITVLEILQKPIPTVLWAPVTKPFPYSILYYTDDAPDHGKYLRKELAAFETQYDVEQYSLTNFIDRIQGPVQLQQGGSDEAVPIAWSTAFIEQLKQTNTKVTYSTYTGADHNMVPDWNTAVLKDVEFFRTYLRNSTSQ